MRKSLKILGSAVVLAAGLVIAPALYADDSHHGSQAPMTAPGMMGPGMTGQGGTMGQGGMMGMMNMMMGMMNMMAQMGPMMEQRGQMMQGTTGGGGSGRPNEQWRKEAPAEPKPAEPK